MTTIRTRFAPSPTGYLHIGGARTALFSWLYARHLGGQFLLRIEDTDLARSTEESIQAIYDGMAWLGLDYNGDVWRQTERLPRYQAVIDQLLDSGAAYRCYCSTERLSALREAQMAAKQKPRYDGHCLQQAPPTGDAPFVVRLRTPREGHVTFQDLVRGPITVDNAELDDLIIARSDGTPTYHLSVVVDDWDSEITHVIRGDDHINNTPRQIHIIQALGAPVPTYAHVPMILGEDGKRLSKRHGAVSVLAYRDQGILQAAMLNMLVRLGWSHGDQEIFSRDEMIKLFDLSHVNHAAAAFNAEKLWWLNKHYLQAMSIDDILPRYLHALKALSCDVDGGPDPRGVVALLQDRVSSVAEMAAASVYFYQSGVTYDTKAQQKFLSANQAPVLSALLAALQDCAWDVSSIHQVIVDVADQLDLKMGKVAMPLRVAVTGGQQSPSIDQTCFLIGRGRVCERLRSIVAKC